MMVAILAVIAWSVAEFRKYELHPSMPSSMAQAKRNGERLSNHNPGANDERTSHQHDLETESARSDEGAASDATEAQKLDSIYSGKEPHSQSSVVANSEARQVPEKVIHGVPINSYLQNHKNMLGYPAVSEDTSAAMKVYLQCMEVKKKGLHYTGEKECERLEGPKEDNIMQKSFARH